MNAKKRHITLISDSAGMDYARRVSLILELPLLQELQSEQQAPHGSYVLRVSGNKLQLEFPGDRRKPFTPVIVPGRTAKGADPLLRSIGMKHATVIDMTAGWCVDASRIAWSGCQTMAFESDPLVYVLTRNGIQHCPFPAIRNNLNLRLGNSAQILRSENITADVFYLDPMYPPHQRDAASPKAIALLRELVGETQSPDALDVMFEAVMRVKGRRVVIKRPLDAPAIRQGKVGEIRSKQVRYDIYFSGSANEY